MQLSGRAEGRKKPKIPHVVCAHPLIDAHANDAMFSDRLVATQGLVSPFIINK